MQKNDVNHNSNKAQGDSKMDQDQRRVLCGNGDHNNIKGTI